VNLKIVRSHRRSISLEVKADASLVIRAPIFVPEDYIHALVRQKQLWISKKQQQTLEWQRQSVKPGPIEVEAAKKKAQEIIPQRVRWYSKATGIRYRRVRISNARKRWGSCSAKGNLNFSWRLALAPLEVIDYVVVHELSHIVHGNHSQRFWALVNKFYPNYKACRKWLRSEGHLL